MIHLLDVRGYEIHLEISEDIMETSEGSLGPSEDSLEISEGCLETSEDSQEPSEASRMTIEYLGAAKGGRKELTYDEDPYVVSRIEDQTFVRQTDLVLKDPAIRESGLKLRIKGAPGREISLSVCGELLMRASTDSLGILETVIEVEDVCAEERAYLDRVHEILCLLLAEIDQVCKKYGLSYFLVFGGLLGSLRHGAIIPWDDDIDIAMTREDFERFKEAAPKELGEDFMYLDCSSMGGGSFLDFLCRVVYMKETVPVNVFRKVGGRSRKDVENHLPMDIYILDRASDSPLFHKLHMGLIRGVYGLGMGHRAYLSREEYKARGSATWMAVRLLSLAGKCLPVKWIFRLHDWVSKLNQGKNTRDYFMSNGYLPFIHTRYSCGWFVPGNQVKLGDLTVSAPSDVKAYLKRAYYDYYHYPPVHKRIPEHSPKSKGVF